MKIAIILLILPLAAAHYCDCFPGGPAGSWQNNYIDISNTDPVFNSGASVYFGFDIRLHTTTNKGGGCLSKLGSTYNPLDCTDSSGCYLDDSTCSGSTDPPVQNFQGTFTSCEKKIDGQGSFVACGTDLSYGGPYSSDPTSITLPATPDDLWMRNIQVDVDANADYGIYRLNFRTTWDPDIYAPGETGACSGTYSFSDQTGYSPDLSGSYSCGEFIKEVRKDFYVNLCLGDCQSSGDCTNYCESGTFYSAGSCGTFDSPCQNTGVCSYTTTTCTCNAGGTACEGSCTPDCSGLVCGDDGCGGSCGTCNTGEFCNSGACETTCTPDCTGLACGDDGCGGSCGTCGTGEVCNSGVCESTCTLDCVNKECGSDGCGGSCGSCEDYEYCDAQSECALDCIDDCDTTGDKFCADNTLQECGNYDDDPCLEYEYTDCGSDLCQNAECVSSGCTGATCGDDDDCCPEDCTNSEDSDCELVCSDLSQTDCTGDCSWCPLNSQCMDDVECTTKSCSGTAEYCTDSCQWRKCFKTKESCYCSGGDCITCDTGDICSNNECIQGRRSTSSSTTGQTSTTTGRTRGATEETTSNITRSRTSKTEEKPIVNESVEPAEPESSNYRFLIVVVLGVMVIAGAVMFLKYRSPPTPPQENQPQQNSPPSFGQNY